MRITQKGWIVLGLSVFLTGALLCGLALPALLPAPAQAVAADAEADLSGGYRYLVREYQGQVAVFLPKQLYGPKYVTGIRVDSLPQADREALEAGIRIRTDAQLTALLEDLGS